MRKDDDEIGTLREAAELLSEVARDVFEEIRGDGPSGTSRWPSTTGSAARDFERPAFDTIVASGPSAALPHATPGERN